MASPTVEKREIRDTVQSLELRAAPAGSTSPGTIAGYAAMFNRLSLDLGYFREQIAPGAFKNALARCDVRALCNHEPSNLLGRTSARTLRLAEDEFGLRMECDLPNASIGRDVVEWIGRGDIQGQSFAFTVAVDQWDWSGEVPIRTLVEIDELFDVGPVTYPSYEETSVALRSFQRATEQRTANAAAAVPTVPPAAIQSQRDKARLRLLEVF